MDMFPVAFKMKLPALALVLLTAGSAAGVDEAALRADAQKVFKEKVGPFVNKYCTRCHGSRAKAGINLQSALKNPGGASASLHWKKAMANVKVHDMPPEDASKKPTDEERRQFVEWIGKHKYLAPRDPGLFVIRRLTKVEYGNTLRDLYGVDPSVTDSLPDEVLGEGYLNSISPLQSELFLEVANKVVNLVMVPVGKVNALGHTSFSFDTAQAVPYLAYADTLALGRLVRDHLSNHPKAPRLAETIECDSADALLEYALKGLGVAWLPWSLAAGACKAKQLAPVGSKALEIGFEIRMVRAKRKLSPAAESFWQTVDPG